MNKKICLTGVTGFLGKKVVSELVKEPGFYLRCLVRKTSDVEALLDNLPKETHGRIEFLRGDLNQPDFVLSAFKNIDIFYHIAAAPGGGASQLFLNSVVPMRAIIAAALKQKVQRFVLISSMGIYGPQNLPSGTTLDERSPIDLQPEKRDAYTFSKARQESIAWDAFQKHQLPLVIVRPGVIYGPGRPLLTSRVGLQLGSFLLGMGGRQFLPYTYVENCAEAVKLAGTTPDLEGKIVNIVDDELPTGRQLLRAYRQHKNKIKALFLPLFLVHPFWATYAAYCRLSQGQLPLVLDAYKSKAMWKRLSYSNTEAHRLLGWKPKISLTEGIQKTLIVNSKNQ
jgi:nucleoside-diphosphate-sugar epimerase